MNQNIITTGDVILPNDFIGIGYYYFNKIKQYASQNKIAQIVEKTGENDSYESLLKRCIRTSMFLQKIGIKKDDVIALIGPKHVHSVVSFISSHFIGAIPTCVAYDYPENDIKSILKSMEPKIIFTDSKCLTFLKKYLLDIKLGVKFIVFDDCEEGFSFSEIIKLQPGEEKFEPVKIDNIKNTAIIYYSSGATGLPKAICLSHYAMLASVVCFDPSDPDIEALAHLKKQYSNGCRFLDYQPLYWISSEISKWIHEGNTRILVEKFEALKFWEIVNKYKANYTFILPYSLIELSKYPKPEHLNIDSLCLIVVCGFHAKAECMVAVRKMVHPLSTVMSRFGQTEFNGGTILYDIRDKTQRKYINEKLNSVGMVTRGLSVKVCVNGCMGDNMKKSAQLPLDHSETVPVPPKYITFVKNPGKANSVFTVSVAANDDHDDPDFEPEPSSSKDPIPVSQELLDKMVAVSNLSHRGSEQLATFLKQDNNLAFGVKVTSYRKRQEYFQKHYTIVDLDTNEILGPNKSGEILMKGERCFNGYYKMDSMNCFEEDGYFRTGDIGYYDEDKCFYIVDRLKGIFTYKNFPRISSSIIEEIVIKHPAVKSAAVFGYPHPIDQNHVTAVVVLEENAQATSEEIRNFVDSKVEDYKRLRGGIKIVKELPLTPTGKIKSRDLKALVDQN
ncbi:unnamed protein product [Brassicogethes aeneus]|uniref:Uncharacterized protein n=1 Tax=Brassicogethes aeneus TaxID=1431903 RepID=A0A9P0AUG9_BRAAE|nr:unnamed protein product [Brassicogethes aeneus]